MFLVHASQFWLTLSSACGRHTEVTALVPQSFQKPAGPALHPPDLRQSCNLLWTIACRGSDIVPFRGHASGGLAHLHSENTPGLACWGSMRDTLKWARAPRSSQPRPPCISPLRNTQPTSDSGAGSSKIGRTTHRTCRLVNGNIRLPFQATVFRVACYTHP